MVGDIRSLAQLAPHVSVGATFKFSKDGGQTWTYVKIIREQINELYADGSRGFAANAEVSSRGVGRFAPLVDRDFANGMIVRIATDEEVRNVKWSYE